jgi:hypothetical protein
VSLAAVALAQVKTVLIDPRVYLRADELASWGLILRVPPRKRDRIAWNDADDRRAPALPQVGVFHYAQPCRKTGAKRFVALVTNKAVPVLGVFPMLGRNELLAKA